MSANDGVVLVRYQGARARCSVTSSGRWPCSAYQTIASDIVRNWKRAVRFDGFAGAIARVADAEQCLAVFEGDFDRPAIGVAFDDLAGGAGELVVISASS